jgi:hypothetical protein
MAIALAYSDSALLISVINCCTTIDALSMSSEDKPFTYGALTDCLTAHLANQPTSFLLLFVFSKFQGLSDLLLNPKFFHLELALALIKSYVFAVLRTLYTLEK